ncbi:ABC transporter ATP-binding protein [Paragemmobacter ruber]|uniref:ATP-binding cassette domain-containing protein n=1 Tax=Paragemmobacter ruber TaxID=1985673 RepID=A0ABW9Y6M3_9RHOB|nr:ABC transporter ATP-binding protein [Rhodobacter ruber]NBE08169.1 ATP-binding cassette domain-containing protein [Rhodobacter ruber]
MSLQLSLKSVDKFYGPVGKGVHAVKSISMDVPRGDIIALLGSSGCGKTSTLRMIAGFETVSRGTIELAGKQVQTLPPVRRNVAMAFEGYSLYPTVTVRDNIAFALKASRLAEAEVARRVAHVTEMLEITDILDRFPSSISGGQQQRASLARALVRDADLHLLDEPMGQLEPQLRTLLRGRIKHYVKERGLTAILVTHDQTEANALADRIAVMEGGVLQQYGSPAEIKERPANLFTGTFVGEPPMNVFPASVSVAAGRLTFDLTGGLDLRYDEAAFDPRVRKMLLDRKQVVIGVRPYAVHRVETGAAARVVANQWLGDQSHIAASFAGKTIVLVEHDRAPLSEGEPIRVEIRPQDLHVFDPTTGLALSHGNELAA